MKKISLILIIAIVSISCNKSEDIPPVDKNVRVSSITLVDGNNGTIIGDRMTFTYNEAFQLVKITRNGSDALYFYEDNKLIRSLHVGGQNIFYEYNANNQLIKIHTDSYDWVRTYEYINNDIIMSFNSPYDNYQKMYTMNNGNMVNYKLENQSVTEAGLVYDNNPSFLTGTPFAFSMDFLNLSIVIEGFTNKNNPVSTDFQTISYEYNEAGYPITLESKAVNGGSDHFNYVWKIEYKSIN
jgi:YD repeat-containing protein